MPFVPESEIDGRVVVESIDAERWKLMAPLRYIGDTQTFTVPSGFTTDFASVPRVAVWLIPKFGRYTRSAILHDWLIHDGSVSPVDADGIFRRSMRELGVPPVRRWLMWAGVRWGALGNPRRRAGWDATALPVLGITVLALPLAVPMIGVAAGMALYSVAEIVATGGRRKGTLST